jgi:Domain of unknown function (DUF5666)
MNNRYSRRALAAAAALSISGAAFVPVAGASVHHSTMAPVTEVGKIAKVLSATSFTVKVGSKTYTVTTDAMTHVTLNKMSVKVSKLKAGDSVTVKGPLEMMTIKATSVVAGM